MKITIICRGSARAGLGHLVRARSFARVAALKHQVTLVAITDPCFRHLVEVPGILVRCVDRDEQVAKLLRAESSDVVVFDLVDLEAGAIRAAQWSEALMVSLSPVFSQMDAMDALFTRAFRPPEIEGVRVFHGLEYAVFSDACVPIPQPVYEANLGRPTLPVALSLGGGDSANHTEILLRRLIAIDPPCSIWVLLGDAYEHSFDALVRMVRDVPRHEIILARANQSMWHVISNCAVGVLSSGLSTMESIYAGLPVIAVHRQNDPSWQFSTAYDDYCLDGGSLADDSYGRAAEHIVRLHNDREQLLALRHRQQGIVGPGGAAQILHRIEELLGQTSGTIGGMGSF